ncbi:MAG: tRNA threonylcarbamoyladenosine biosynthesis protein RimN [Gammaproteobacteria bacterium SG8_15]|nr:MAG: tRNA threonylcarbamoyladenosine biosynthesis protein RimN [Gammaproteobacteria bacterium SG8_15]
MSSLQINEAVQILQQGGVIAYPTEAVYGLGCDPNNHHAVERLLAIKQRSRDKGLILIAADFQQLRPYLAEIDNALKAKILATWPGPVTWLWPAKPTVSSLLRGKHDTIAVRVTAHPLAAALCREFGGPLVSTSANLSGELPTRTADEVRGQLGEQLDYVLEGKTGERAKPSEIRDALSGAVLR